MGTINLILPDVLHERIHELAGKHKVSVNSLVTTVLAETILALSTEVNPCERSRRRHASQARNDSPGMAAYRMESLRN